MTEDEIMLLALEAKEILNEENKITIKNESNKNFCYECNMNFVISGNSMVCMGCGKMGDDIICDEPEWNNSEQGVNNSRCSSMPNNELYEGNTTCGGTTVSRFTKNTPKYLRYTWDNSRNRSLYKVYTNLDNIAEKYDITLCILDTCKHIYKYISCKKLTRGSIREASIACCMYYAYIYNNSRRTKEEVGIMFKVSTKKMNQVDKDVSKLLWENKQFKHLISSKCNIHDYVYRFVSKLNIDQKYSKNCIDYYNNLDKNKVIGKDESYITAGIIHIICTEFVSKDKICDVCNLSTVTLNKIIKILEE